MVQVARIGFSELRSSAGEQKLQVDVWFSKLQQINENENQTSTWSFCLKTLVHNSEKIHWMGRLGLLPLSCKSVEIKTFLYNHFL